MVERLRLRPPVPVSAATRLPLITRRHYFLLLFPLLVGLPAHELVGHARFRLLHHLHLVNLARLVLLVAVVLLAQHHHQVDLHLLRPLLPHQVLALSFLQTTLLLLVELELFRHFLILLLYYHRLAVVVVVRERLEHPLAVVGQVDLLGGHTRPHRGQRLLEVLERGQRRRLLVVHVLRRTVRPQTVFRLHSLKLRHYVLLEVVVLVLQVLPRLLLLHSRHSPLRQLLGVGLLLLL